ncbi:hypothetical protein [Paraburkholderia pallida]|uniref:Uncharacterized protein n=1 Tax=Paraburkholderia pallida TaxID=2547399 RepID=A0A4P7CWS7_9BURK|nr:hypothetical protein [Paraburkholderia pallida]QBQ99246.1 hypothetical protein E1956_18755 [Paraburkholderia pallida]
MKQRTKPHISFFMRGDSAFVRVDISHLPCGVASVVEGPISKKRGDRRMRGVRRAFSNAVYAAHLRGWNALTGQTLPTVNWDWGRGRPQRDHVAGYAEYKARRLAEMKAAGVEL